jgi:aspartyl aminopeptidase
MATTTATSKTATNGSIHQFAEKACAFLTSSTDPFHAVSNAIARLESAGFTRSSNSSMTTTTLERGGKYYYTVQNSTLVAFTVGSQFSNQNTNRSGFKIIGGHTDSPNLRVKPRSKIGKSTGGAVQIGVECYGGGLWHTWFDRDLGISGKVLVRDEDSNNQDKIVPKLVKISNPPIARVSTLCIHLQSAEERQAFAVNKETHTIPIIGMVPNKELEASLQQQISGQQQDDKDQDKPNQNDPWQQGQEPRLLQKIASQLQIPVSQIADFDLSFFDTQPAQLGGLDAEFLYSGRLDNLATVFCAVEALAEHDPTSDADISMIVCFDHEEVGSVSANGAGSTVIMNAVRTIAHKLGVPDSNVSSLLEGSFCLSIDQAHAVHPNYASKHESQHSPTLNGGIVIKTNSNQRYTTNSLTGFILRELGKKCQVPMQEFVGTCTLDWVISYVVMYFCSMRCELIFSLF